MINIHNHLKIDDAALFLDIKAELLWNYLNPKKANGSSYKKNSIIEICNRIKSETTTAIYRTNIAGGDNDMAARHYNFFNYLSINSHRNLKKLIISKPDQFNEIITEINDILRSNDLYTIEDGLVVQTKLGKIITDRLLKYSRYRSSQFCHNLYIELGMNNSYCPYCNKNRIDIVNKRIVRNGETTHRLLFDIDHFYPKSRFPFFALSFYNHIPSCHACNSTIKKDKIFSIETHINPYFESFDDLYKFRLPLTALASYTVDEIKIDSYGIKNPDKTVDDLELVERYQTDFGEISRLLTTFHNYQHYISDGNINDLKRYIFDMHGVKPNKNEILRSPNAKLLRDILKQMDVNNALEID